MRLLSRLGPRLRHRISIRPIGPRQPLRQPAQAVAAPQEAAGARGAAAESSASVFEAVQQRLGKLSAEPLVPADKPLVTVLSGPSGVGKDSVVKALQAARPELHFVVTATTRERRPGETEGVDYLFVDRPQFEAWIEGGELLEHAVVYGQYKGIPRAQVTKALALGHDVVLRLDVQGTATLRRLMPDTVSIFLAAESEEALVRRLVDRKTEPLESMVMRVEAARQELQEAGGYDYIVLNREGQLAAAVEDIEAIMRAEKLRVQRKGLG